MPNRDDFPVVFDRLTRLFAPHLPPLSVATDAPGDYSVVGRPTAKYSAGQPFGTVQIKKNYVSYHLMPIYTFPDLLDGLSDRLAKRKQGKSCFNFTTLDDETLADLARLTAAGFDRYRREQLA